MTATLPQRLGKAFRKRRQALGFSQESYADEIGMHRTYYSAIERGEKNLQLDTLERTAPGWTCRYGRFSRSLSPSGRPPTCQQSL